MCYNIIQFMQYRSIIMPYHINILGADKTITSKSTIMRNSIDFEGETPQTSVQRIAAGALHAERYLKTGIPKPLLELKGLNIFAIAASHNNPDFIAGYIQYILGKRVTTSDEIVYSEEPRVAVKVYHIAGSNKPLLISYIPEKRPSFSRRLSELKGKNEQIQLLKQVLTEKGFADRESSYDFFDVNPHVIELAGELSQLRAHRVMATYEFSCDDDYREAIARAVSAIDKTDLRLLYKAKEIIKRTGLVYSAEHLSREQATKLANDTDSVVLRESSSNPDMIVATLPEARLVRGEKTQIDLTRSISAEIDSNPDFFSRPEEVFHFFARLFKDRGLILHHPASELETHIPTDSAAAAAAASSIPATVSSLEHAKRMIRLTGMVFPAKGLSRDESEKLAKDTGLLVLRESSSEPGLIVASYRKIGAGIAHVNLTAAILRAITHDAECFSTAEKTTGVFTRELGVSGIFSPGDTAPPPVFVPSDEVESSFAQRDRSRAISGAVEEAGGKTYSEIKRQLINAEDMIKQTGYVFLAGQISRIRAEQLAKQSRSVILQESAITGGIIATYPHRVWNTSENPHMDLTPTILAKLKDDPGCFSTREKAADFLRHRLTTPYVHLNSGPAAMASSHADSDPFTPFSEAIASRGAARNPHGLFGGAVAASGAGGAHQVATSAGSAIITRLDDAKERIKQTGLVYSAKYLSRNQATKVANNNNSVVLRESGSEPGLLVATYPEGSVLIGESNHLDLTHTISVELERNPASFSTPAMVFDFFARLLAQHRLTLHRPDCELSTKMPTDGRAPSV